MQEGDKVHVEVFHGDKNHVTTSMEEGTLISQVNPTVWAVQVKGRDDVISAGNWQIKESGEFEPFKEWAGRVTERNNPERAK